MASDTGVRVEIYGSSYTIRSEGAREDILAAARCVDETMREIALATGLSDSLKVAVLAALHIADDLNGTRREIAALDAATSSCSKMLDQLIEAREPAPRRG